TAYSDHHQRLRPDSDHGADASLKHYQCRDDGGDRGRGQDKFDRNERREADTECHDGVPTLGSSWSARWVERSETHHRPGRSKGPIGFAIAQPILELSGVLCPQQPWPGFERSEIQERLSARQRRTRGFAALNPGYGVP